MNKDFFLSSWSLSVRVGHQQMIFNLDEHCLAIPQVSLGQQIQ